MVCIVTGTVAIPVQASERCSIASLLQTTILNQMSMESKGALGQLGQQTCHNARTKAEGCRFFLIVYICVYPFNGSHDKHQTCTILLWQ